MKTLTLIIAGLLLAVLIYAQLPVKPVDGNYNELVVAAAGTRYNSGMTAVPNSDTALSSTTTKVQLIFCANVDSASRTITISDNQGTPKIYFNAVALAPNQSVMLMASPIGLPFASGIRWQASAATAVNCQVVGVQ